MKLFPFKKRYLIVSGILIFLFILLFSAPRAAKWYLVRNSRESIGRNIGLNQLYRSFIGIERMNSWVDTERVLQTGFIANYLSRDREIPAQRFRIIEATPDSIKPDVKYPSFRIYFKAGGE